MEISLNNKHFAIIAVVFLLGFGFGYMFSSIQCQKHEYTNITKQHIPHSTKKAASGNSQKEQARLIFSQASADLGLSAVQKAEVEAIIHKHFPNEEYLTGKIDPIKVYKAASDVKTVLNSQQSAKLDAMLIENLFKR
jgi:hypothetical protein